MNSVFDEYIERGDFTRVSGEHARSGPEYHGACPICGAGAGHGRASAQFVCWPGHPKKQGGGWFCRNCSEGKLKSGIDFLMARDKITAGEAFRALGLDGGAVRRGPRRLPPLPPARSASRDCGHFSRVADAERWLGQAAALLANAKAELKRSQEGQKYLLARGFTPESMARFQFGYIPRTYWADGSAWGMADHGTGKGMTIPRGWLIPIFDRLGRIAALKIRRHPQDLERYPKWGKYHCIQRTASVPSWASPAWRPGRPLVIFEGELDAALVDQDAGGLVNCVSTGSASNLPDPATLDLIGKDPVFVAMDADEAGQKRRAAYEADFPEWESVDQPAGFKDAGEARQAGVDLRAWVRSFLPQTMLCRIAAQAADDAAAENPEKRFAEDNEPGPTRADYESFCPGYWKGCARCPDFDAMKTLFCRRFNREHPDAFPFAEIEKASGRGTLILANGEAGGPAFKPMRCVDCVQWRDAGTAYWSGRCGRTGREIGLRTRCDQGIPEAERPADCR